MAIFIELLNKKIVSQIFVYYLFAGFFVLFFIGTKNRCLVWENTITLFTDAVDKKQYVEMEFTTLASEYAQQKQYNKALSIMEHGEQLFPRSTNIKTIYASTLGLSGNWYWAAEKYKEDLLLDSLQLEVYNNLGDAYLRTHQYQRALQVFLKADTLFPKSNYIKYNLGYTYWLLGDTATASKIFKVLVSNDFKPAIVFFHKNNIR